MFMFMFVFVLMFVFGVGVGVGVGESGLFFMNFLRHCSIYFFSSFMFEIS